MDRALCFSILLLSGVNVTYELQTNVCTSSGRFASPGDETCTKYILCVRVPFTQTFKYYNYTCPTPSLFNPNNSVCTTNYTCKETKVNKSLCNAEGRIPDPTSTNCTKYIQCININSTYQEFPQSCPDGTYFNPNITECDALYSCPYFSCPSSGRFANTTDQTCQSYILCVKFNNGTLAHYSYSCPSISVFNPATELCTTQYKCPTMKNSIL